MPAHRTCCPAAPRPGALPIPRRSYWVQRVKAGGRRESHPPNLTTWDSSLASEGPLGQGCLPPVASACKALNQPAGTSLSYSLRRSGNVPRVLPPLMPTPGQVQRQEPQRQGWQGPQWNTFPRRLRAQALLPPGASPGVPHHPPIPKEYDSLGPLGEERSAQPQGHSWSAPGRLLPTQSLKRFCLGLPPHKLNLVFTNSPREWGPSRLHRAGLLLRGQSRLSLDS